MRACKYTLEWHWTFGFLGLGFTFWVERLWFVGLVAFRPSLFLKVRPPKQKSSGH